MQYTISSIIAFTSSIIFILIGVLQIFFCLFAKKRYNQIMEKGTESTEEHIQRVIQLREEIIKAHEKAKGALFTLSIDRTVTVKDDKLEMLFCLRLALNNKDKAKSEQNPFLNPAKELLITDLGTTHRLLFNKFNIFENHLLVVTSHFEKQSEKISHLDMLNAGLACQALEGILFFNGGELSGASQRHKHLQILPKQAKELPIFSAIHKWITTLPPEQHNKILKFDPFDFLHGVVAINDSEPFRSIGDRLYEAYLILYQELITKSKQIYPQISDYNILACQNFILMAIRKKEVAFDFVSINSVGYMGSLLFKNAQDMEKVISTYTPSQILSDISWK